MRKNVSALQGIPIYVQNTKYSAPWPDSFTSFQQMKLCKQRSYVFLALTHVHSNVLIGRRRLTIYENDITLIYRKQIL